MVGIPDVAEEFRGVSLGDKRLDRRAQSIASRLGANPADSFPKSMGDSGELEAVYRFFQNESVEPAALLAPHQTATLQRANGKTIRVAHDKTSFRFSGDREGMGALGSKGEGFFGQFALAIADGEDREPLGVLSVIPFTRAASEPGRTRSVKTIQCRATPRAQKESSFWKESVAAVESLAGPCTAIHIMDREADDYALFAELLSEQLRFVIRGSSSRRLNKWSPTRVENVLEQREATFLRTVSLSERNPKRSSNYGPRGEREAKLHVRASRFELKPPHHSQAVAKVIALNVVQVIELDSPEGEEPVEWALFTSEPVDSMEQVAAIVDHYRARWRIEEFFKALKTGCAFEKRQLTSKDALVRALALFAPIAWRLLALRVLARLDRPPSATKLFSGEQLVLLRFLTAERKHNMPEDPTMKDAMLAIASLGGFLKRNGEPGWITLGRGYEDFLRAEAGWRAARAAQLPLRSDQS